MKRTVTIDKGKESQWPVKTDTFWYCESASEEYCDEQYGKTDKISREDYQLNIW